MARPEPHPGIPSHSLTMLEIYVWAAIAATIAFVRVNHCRELDEWAAASLAGAIWPVVVIVRIVRWVQREVRRG